MEYQIGPPRWGSPQQRRIAPASSEFPDVKLQYPEIGVEFETELTSDGSGGLCTRHRISPYTVAAAGLPKKPGTAGPNEGKRDQSTPKFMEVST